MAGEKRYTTFEEYVADQPEACHAALTELGELILDTIPTTIRPIPRQLVVDMLRFRLGLLTRAPGVRSKESEPW